MAFGIKFRMNFQDERDIEWEIDILKQGFVGGIKNIKGGSSNPVSIDMESFDDPFEPVCHTNATISITSETIDEFSEFQNADVFEYFCDIKRAGTTYWKGLYITENFQEDFTTPPYSVDLTFNDGLSELQFERYDEAGALRSSFKTVIDILVNCMNELPSELSRGFREMINIFENTMNDADAEGLLEQLFIFEAAFWEKDKDDVIKGIDCLSIIRGIMGSLKCRIIVSENKWYIQRIGEMLTPGSIKLIDYDSSGTVTGNSTIDLRRPLTDFTVSLPTLLAPIENDAVNTFSREYQEVEFTYSSKNITILDNNVVINGAFDKGYETENGSPVPLHWKRSASVNTALASNPEGLHLSGTGSDISLVMEDSLLALVKISFLPVPINDILQVDSAHENFNLLAESPTNNTITYKNILTDTSDHLEIRFKGFFDYTYTDVSVTGPVPAIFNKWTIQLGSKFYNTSNKSWDTNSTNRVWTTEAADFWNDIWITQTATVRIRRHFFDRTVILANFPADSVDDLTITWFIPETYRFPNNFNSNEVISAIDITFDQMQIAYVSNNSTEFEIQKVLGETGSTTLRSKRFTADVKHGDGPSAFSVNSFRLATSNLPTSTWNSRGGVETLPGFKILVINPIFENLGTYRQVWSGSLYGFLELHNTISNLDSKIFIIKSYSYNVRAVTHTVTLHEVDALAPVITFKVQFDLSLGSNPVDSDETQIGNTETVVDAVRITTQGGDIVNADTISVADTQVIRTNNDTTGTGGDYPI